jgi:hypothetical protein
MFEKLKCALQSWPINSQGYDPDGCYWGIGPRLYHCIPPEIEGYEDWFLRARNREDAKVIVRAKWPNATFYR